MGPTLKFVLAYSIPVALIAFFLTAYLRVHFFEKYKRKSSRNREWIFLIFSTYMALLIFFLFLPNWVIANHGIPLGIDLARSSLSFRPSNPQEWGVNFIPFHTIKKYLHHVGGLHSFTNIFGNIIISIPMGFGLPLLWHRFSKFKSTLGFSAMFFTIIEFLQHFVGRSTDIDDLILNLIGISIGYLIYRLLEERLNLRQYKR